MQHTTISYQQAQRYVERKLGFYAHLIIYIVVNSGLLLAASMQAGSGRWSLGPLLGWGLGLLFHGLVVFLRKPGSGWKQRMIERELNKH